MMLPFTAKKVCRKYLLTSLEVLVYGVGNVDGLLLPIGLCYYVLCSQIYDEAHTIPIFQTQIQRLLMD
jgi:hypothetical protein